MDLNRLPGVLAPFYVLLMDHDLPNEQPQQFRGQFLDVGVPFCQGDEMVCAAHFLPQCLNGRLLCWDFFLEPGQLLRVAAGESLELLRRDAAQYAVLVLNAVGIPVQSIVLAETAVQGGDLHLV